MPKYYPFKIADHYLYFTSECIVEAMHVHASDRKLTEAQSAKFLSGRTEALICRNAETSMTGKSIRLESS